MKKLVTSLVVLAMLLVLATSAFAMPGVGSIIELQIGENVVEHTAYYDEEWEEWMVMPAQCMWTADEAGTLTIDFSDEDEATAWCQIIHNNAYEYIIQDKGGSVSFDVEVGDTLYVIVVNADE